ncbi:hypothetical protein Nepgr_031493 [Nepenthes gracilis]|uniref:pyruvate kinase n=1 Tax=Nepenthes gracilis TaxID=150966 RepID=A0AAD3THI0_NEPGR|nr:hypothetical protein Nepgr_031493 [Nepenthes gracilis]
MINAIPDDSRELERGSSHAYSDEEISLVTKVYGKYEDPALELISSSQISKEGLLRGNEQPSEEADILDRLCALRLQLSTSEQWNASQLEKYYRFLLYILQRITQQMMLSILSVKAIQTTYFSDFRSSQLDASLTRQPCRLSCKKPFYRNHFFHSFFRQMGKHNERCLALEIPNASRKLERSSLHNSSDNEIFTPCKNYKSFEDPLLEHRSKSDEQIRNEGNILGRLKALHLHLLASEQSNASLLKLCHRSYLTSSTNLIHYIALKCLDMEHLKEDLFSIGLLNLETVNPFILPSLAASIQMLEISPRYSLAGKKAVAGMSFQKRLDMKNENISIDSMKKLASSNRDRLLGLLQEGRTTHIMVTVGQEAVESEMITDILKAGATIVRINCAHGNHGMWSEIIRRVREASQKLEKPCRILMDLAGPKLRTGNPNDGPCVMKISPTKNATGYTIFPAKVWVSCKGSGPPSHLSPDAVLYVDSHELFPKLKLDDAVRFRDARGKQRMLKVSGSFCGYLGFMADCFETAYIQLGTELYVKTKENGSSVGFVVDVPPIEQFIRLRVGDQLIISQEITTKTDEVFEHHKITCSSDHLFNSVKPGEPIAFDDGMIWGVIQSNSSSEIVVSITHSSPKGKKLGSEKSINIPASTITFQGLTSKDLTDLEFVALHADMAGISFVREARDVEVLLKELQKRKLGKLGIVLKIETKDGVKNLPQMILEAMKAPNPLGVMIARGDLAVECG